MEIIVCILTTLFFAVLEIRDIKARYAGIAGSRIGEEAFMVLPLYGVSPELPAFREALCVCPAPSTAGVRKNLSGEMPSPPTSRFRP